MKNIINHLVKFGNKLKDDHVNEYAAECAYFTILSFIPFIIIFITLIQYTVVDKDATISLITGFIPNNMQGIIVNIIEEVYSKSAGTISIAVIIALWSAGKGFFSLCKGFRKIYNLPVGKTNIFTRIRGTLYALIFSLSLICVLVIRVFGNRIHLIIFERFEEVGRAIYNILKLRTITLIIILFVVFLLIYRFMPRHKLKLRTQVYGALFSSVSCYTLSWFFSIYVDIFKGFANTYGSLTTIILIMMWLYYCMYSILIGAEINTLVYEHKKTKSILKLKKSNE